MKRIPGVFVILAFLAPAVSWSCGSVAQHFWGYSIEFDKQKLEDDHETIQH